MDHATASRKWLESTDGVPVLEFLQNWRNSVLRTLEEGSDPAELHRAQGRYQVLNRILGLADEIRAYQNRQHRGAVGKVS